jgi:ankyrin repeat protein
MSADLEGLRALIRENPSLATAKSSTSHPTLLQCLVLDGADLPNKIEMAQVLIDAGADINGGLAAAASIDNVESAKTLLDAGAEVNGTRGWSPLEEALYWGNKKLINLLTARGASLSNLRIAAALGKLDLIESFFNPDGSLKASAGKIDWPFGDLSCVQLPAETGLHERQNVVNNAFVYACAHNRIEAARLLLQKGAEIDAIPPGFDYAGTGLHYAALRGHQQMVEFLLGQGADLNIKDTKVQSTAAGWADYGGHKDLRDFLLEKTGLKDQ